MALITFEGFDALQNDTSTTNIRDDLINAGQFLGWSANPPTGQGDKVAGQLGGSAWSSQGSANSQLIYSFSSQTTFIIGHRLQIPAQGLLKGILTLSDSAGGSQIGLCNNSSNQLSVFRGTTATILATGPTVLSSTTWYYVEFMATINGTTGSFTVKFNGVQEMTASNVNTQATSNSNVAKAVWAWNAATNLLVDDFYLCDNTGPAPLNTFLCSSTNPIRVETLFCTANNSVAFTPNASTNVSQIQEVNSDNDATFNSATTAAIDMFTHTSLVSNPKNIYAVNVTAKMRSDDVSNMTARTKLNSNGTIVNGATQLQGTVYEYLKDIYTTDPATTLAWTNAAVNATIIGYERVT